VKSLLSEAKQVGSLQSQFKDAAGAVSGFLGQLKKTVSVTNIYQRSLEEMRRGQENYSKSILASTSQLGRASQQNQKYIDALHDSYVNARNIAADYGVEASKVRQIADELQSSFASQLGVMDNQSKALQDLQKQTFLFSRMTGISATEAIQRMDERLKGSLMTLEEVREEQMRVLKVVDDYKNALNALGKEAQKTGQVTAKEFLQVLGGVRQEFRLGNYDAVSYAKSIKTVLQAGKGAGLTAGQAKDTARGFGQMMGNMSKFTNFFGAKSAMVFENAIQNVDQIQDKALKQQIKTIQASDLTGVQRLEAISNALAGTGEGQALLLDQMAQNFSPAMMREWMKQQGGLTQMQALVLQQKVSSGELQGQLKKDAQKSLGERKKETDVFTASIEQLAKEGATATKLRYRMAKDLHALKQRALAYFEDSPMEIALAMAAVQAGAGLLKGVAGRLLGRLGLGGAASTAGKGAGMLSRIGGGLGRLGTVARAPLGAAAGGAGIAGTAAAGAAAFAAGYGLGKIMDPIIGKEISKSIPKALEGQMGAALGKDRSVSGMLSQAMVRSPAWNKFMSGLTGVEISANQKALDDMLKNTVRIRRGVYLELKKRRLQLMKEVKEGQKNWDDLSYAEREILKAKKKELDQINKTTKRRREMEEKEKKQAPEKMVRTLMKDIGKDVGKFQLGDITGREDLRKNLQEMMLASPRLMRYKGGEEAMKRLMSEGGQGADFVSMMMQQAAGAGIGEKEFFQMFGQERKRVAGWQSSRVGWMSPEEHKRVRGQIQAGTFAPKTEVEKLGGAGAGAAGSSTQVTGDLGGAPAEVKDRRLPDGRIERTTTSVVGVKQIQYLDPNTSVVHAKNVQSMKDTNTA
jgi:hypothetical protein